MAIPKYHMAQVFDPSRAHPNDAHSILMRHIPPNSRVLELGCASGYLSGYMEQALGCRVTGLEADPSATAIAAERCTEVHTVDLDTSGALEPSHASAPYNVLLAAAILEHLKSPERLLREARNMLTPGARVIVSLPNIAHWSFRLRLLAGKFDYEDYGVMDRTHLHLYTEKTGRALLENQGYTVEWMEIAGSGLQNLLHSAGLDGSPPRLVLPGLLGYELIYFARVPG